MPPPGRQTSANQRRASSEVDIDGGMSESEPTGETSRVPQSDEIVRQLEKSVPRWEGFGPAGWSTTIQLVRFFSSPRVPILNKAVQADALPIVEQIRDYKDARCAPSFVCKNLTIPTHLYSGTRLSTILDVVPDMDSKLNFPQVVGIPYRVGRLLPLTMVPQQRPLSLKLIEVSSWPDPLQQPEEIDRIADPTPDWRV